MNNTEKKDFFYWFEAITFFMGKLVMISILTVIAGIAIIMPIHRYIFELDTVAASARLNELEIISKSKPLNIDQEIEFYQIKASQLQLLRRNNDHHFRKIIKEDK